MLTLIFARAIVVLNTYIMTLNKITEVVIYESPDGGHTVYARNTRSNTRTLHSQSSKLTQELAELEKQKRWQEILATRDNNPEINRLCEQIEIVYELSKN